MTQQNNIYYLLLTKKSKFPTIVTIVFQLAVDFQPKMQKLFKAHSGFVKGKPNQIKLKKKSRNTEIIIQLLSCQDVTSVLGLKNGALAKLAGLTGPEARSGKTVSAVSTCSDLLTGVSSVLVLDP